MMKNGIAPHFKSDEELFAALTPMQFAIMQMQVDTFAREFFSNDKSSEPEINALREAAWLVFDAWIKLGPQDPPSAYIAVVQWIKAKAANEVVRLNLALDRLNEGPRHE